MINVTVTRDRKPRFDPGGSLPVFVAPAPQSVTDATGVTWTGPVVTGGMDLDFALYQEAASLFNRNPQRSSQPLHSDPVLDAHLRR